MSDRSQLDDLFDQALRLPRSDRTAFVQDRAPDPATRSRLRELLSAFDEAPDFLETPAIRAPQEEWTDRPSSAEAPGTRVGRYELRELIGEGGFGAVYVAEQSEPVKRTVALKIIKLGMDTRQVITRFEAERQALALMDHPNIARVFDAGATETGRPYFVMEFVQGRPITEYCDARQIDIDGRLKLFSQVCRAVQHAHQKGVIHRDLKPSNVLVAGNNGDATPKVIDFGIAKATSSDLRLTDRTLTEHRHLIGTPEYMSPEQASMMSLDVDTRSDIYSLGALLYELIAGTPPLDARRLRSVDFDEMRRIIREEDPVKPSTRLCSLDTAEQVALRRGLESARLSRRLHGDLDWIVMKCLEKDRERRYETADGLASDIQRHLANEPIAAHPPSRIYRTMKFVRRHRAWTVGAGLVSLTILLGLGGTSWGILWALNERNRAEDRAEETRLVADFQAAMLSGIDPEEMGRGFKDRFRERVKAAVERQYVGEGADRRPPTTEEVDARLAAFDDVAGAAHAADVARRIMDEFVLSPAAKALKEGFHDQPLVQAQLHDAIGRSYSGLGIYDAAEPHLRKALAIRQRELGEHEQVALSLHNMAHLLMGKGDYAAAEPLFREALAMNRKFHGDEHEAVAECLSDVGQVLTIKGDYLGAERLVREALAMRRRLLGDEHPAVASSLHDLGRVCWKRGDLAAAEPLFREALVMNRKFHGDEHEAVADSLDRLAGLLFDQGDYAAAEPLIRESLAIKRKLLGDEHPDVPFSLALLAGVLDRGGDDAAAEPLYREALAMQRKLLGDEHPDVAIMLNNLARMLSDQGDYSAAQPLYRDLLAIGRKTLGDEHLYLDLAKCLNDLAVSLQQKGDHAAAEPLLREGLTIACCEQPGSDRRVCALILHHLADSLRVMGELDEAERLARQAVDIYRASADPSPSAREQHSHAVIVFSQTLVDLGRPDEAILIWRKFVDDCRRLWPTDDGLLAKALAQLAGLSNQQDRYAEAESVFRELLLIREKSDGRESADYANALASLGLSLLQQDKYAEAEPILRECLEIRKKALHPDSPYYWSLANARSMLGGALARQGAALIESDATTAIAGFTEAEPLLVDSTEWLLENAESVPQERLRQALERIVSLYESWDTLAPDGRWGDQVAKWRAELEKIEEP